VVSFHFPKQCAFNVKYIQGICREVGVCKFSCCKHKATIFREDSPVNDNLMRVTRDNVTYVQRGYVYALLIVNYIAHGYAVVSFSESSDYPDIIVFRDM
jgi:hypothetical protein